MAEVMKTMLGDGFGLPDGVGHEEGYGERRQQNVHERDHDRGAQGEQPHTVKF
jgi:hypothetical protein